MTDYISRADAIEALCHNCAYYTDEQCKTDSGYWCESGAMIMEDIPSAEVVSVKDARSIRDLILVKEYLRGRRDASADRPSGVWIWCGDKGDSRFMCSVCKSKENVPTCMGEPTIWDYCPSCGARMKGGAE